MIRSRFLRRGCSRSTDYFVDDNAAPFSFFGGVALIFSSSKEEGFSIGVEGGGGDAEADVLVVEAGAGFVVEEGGVPVAFEDASGHDEEFSTRMESEGFHEAFSDFAFDGGAGFFDTIVPGEVLPELFSISGGGISGAAHAGEVEGFVVGREVEGEDAAGVVVALDDAPTGKIGSLDAGNFLTVLFEVPEDDFAHEVAGGEEFAVV